MNIKSFDEIAMVTNMVEFVIMVVMMPMQIEFEFGLVGRSMVFRMVVLMVVVVSEIGGRLCLSVMLGEVNIAGASSEQKNSDKCGHFYQCRDQDHKN